jgi:hypothetical protein
MHALRDWHRVGHTAIWLRVVETCALSVAERVDVLIAIVSRRNGRTRCLVVHELGEAWVWANELEPSVPAHDPPSLATSTKDSARAARGW